VPEHLARSHQVEHPAVVHHLDGARADHAQELSRLGALGEDHLAAGVELDLHGAGEALDRGGVEFGERRVLTEKLNDVGIDRHFDLPVRV
jgi:hypothetical protein